MGTERSWRSQPGTSNRLGADLHTVELRGNEMKRLLLILVIVLNGLLAASISSQAVQALKVTPSKTSTGISLPADVDTPTLTDTPTETETPTIIPTLTDTLTPTLTFTPGLTSTVTRTFTPSGTPTPILPFPGALLCPDSGMAHDNSLFHTIWDSVRGCHYDHEHGQNPFTPEVSATFPGFDLRALIGGVGVSHTNPSSPMENGMKHGGHKWFVMLNNPHGCLAGFESALWCVKAAVIQYHTFGDYSMEFDARKHSVVYLLLVCNPNNINDCGTIFLVNLEDYGNRVAPYNTTVIPYPDNPQPAYAAGFGPYDTVDCIYANLPGCRTGIPQIINSNLNTVSKWTSKPTGPVSQPRPPGNRLADLLFDVRNTYQVLDSRDLTYPFTFAWVCTTDNGLTYNPIGCKHNNSAHAVHEVNGVIPGSWDNLAGVDTNPTIGRITMNAFVDELGNLAPSCTVAGGSCYPIKMQNMFVGKYGDYLSLNKVSIINADNTPSSDIYFCNGIPCSETSPGAVPSGWFGSAN
jgi:hypothetical protein